MQVNRVISNQAGFQGKIRYSEEFRDLIARVLISKTESVNPTLRMFNKIEKRLPKQSELDIYSFKYMRPERSYFVVGTLKRGELYESINFALKDKQVFFKDFVLTMLDESVLGKIGKVHDYLIKKMAQTMPKANRKIFFNEIMAANKRLKAQIRLETEGSSLARADYIATEIASK